MMYEVRLYRNKREVIDNMSQEKIEQMLNEPALEVGEIQMKYVYPDEVAWCKERDMPGVCYMQWLDDYRSECVFEFENESDAILFRLIWA